MNDKIRDTLCDMGYEDSIVFDAPDYDEAIVGVTDDGQVVYDYELMVKCLTDRGMSAEEAADLISYDTMRAIPYAGDNPPIIMNRLPTIDLIRE